MSAEKLSRHTENRKLSPKKILIAAGFAATIGTVVAVYEGTRPQVENRPQASGQSDRDGKLLLRP